MDQRGIRRRIRRHSAIGPILAVAVLVMIFGTWRLQPHLTIPDETGAIARALQIGYEADIFIDNFKKGGNLHLYLLAVSFLPAVLYWLITGRFDEIISGASGLDTRGWDVAPELLAAFYDVMFAGRLLSVAFGVGTVVVVYLVGTELDDRRAGLYAGAFLAVSVGYAMAAHYATEDVPMVFFIMLTLLLAVRAVESDDRRVLLFSAVTLGLATSSKALAGLAVVPVGLVILDRHRDVLGRPGRFIRRTWIYPVAALAAYALTTPSLFVHPESWYAEVARYATSASGGNVVYERPDPGWLLQLAHLSEAMSLPLFLFGLASIVIVLWALRRDRIDSRVWLLFAFAGPHLLVVSIGKMVQFPRILPLVAVLAVVSGLGAARLADRQGWHRTAVRGLLALLFVFAVASTGFATANFNTSRIDATEWTHDNIEEGATVDVHAQRVYLPEFPDRVEVNRIVIHSTYPRSSWQPALDRLDCASPDYVVLSSFHYDRFFRDPTTYPAVTDRYDRLLAERGEYEIVSTHGPPITRDHTAAARFAASADLARFPLDGNPTIVVLERTE
jgi:4-amino-4-deoxy-L-arabinose transferase-like glycosyltransferase